MRNKKIFVLLFLIISLVILSACSSGNAVSDNRYEVDSLTMAPTGEGGEPVIQKYLFYEGVLYRPKVVSGIDSKEEINHKYPGYEYVAAIDKITTDSVFEEELEASGFLEGDEVYVKEDSVLVYGNGTIYEMEKVTK